MAHGEQGGYRNTDILFLETDTSQQALDLQKRQDTQTLIYSSWAEAAISNDYI
jgi:hypothetical protein